MTDIDSGPPYCSVCGYPVVMHDNELSCDVADPRPSRSSGRQGMTDIDRLVERLTKQRTIAEHRAELGDDWNGDYERAYDLMVMDCRAAAAALKEQQATIATLTARVKHLEDALKASDRMLDSARSRSDPFWGNKG